MHFVKIPAILSTVPDLSSVVLLERHRENRDEQGMVGHSRTRGTVVFFDLFKKLKTLNFKVSMVI